MLQVFVTENNQRPDRFWTLFITVDISKQLKVCTVKKRYQCQWTCLQCSMWEEHKWSNNLPHSPTNHHSQRATSNLSRLWHCSLSKYTQWRQTRRYSAQYWTVACHSIDMLRAVARAPKPSITYGTYWRLNSQPIHVQPDTVLAGLLQHCVARCFSRQYSVAAASSEHCSLDISRQTT